MLAIVIAAHLMPMATSGAEPVPLARARELRGQYVHAGKILELDEQSGKLFLFQFDGLHKVELMSLGDRLVVGDSIVNGPEITVKGDELTLRNETYVKTSTTRPPDIPPRWRGLIGEYGPDTDILYILERHGKLCALIQSKFEQPLVEFGLDRYRVANQSLSFSRAANGRAERLEIGGKALARRHLDGETDATFKVEPVRPVAAIRAEFQTAKPPMEAGKFRSPDLVEPSTLDPSIRLDIRYATDNNFLGTPLYTKARAFLQRPAAEAVARINKAVKEQGYQLLIHDAYRPWSVTKLFWEAVPPSGKGFVADPAKGSKHNRGAAVDLSLFSLADNAPAKMVGGYDEFSPRSHPYYPGGTSRERWQRNLLRYAMEAEGFTVNSVEWWHFDYKGWDQYPILNIDFDRVGTATGSTSRPDYSPTSQSGRSPRTAPSSASARRAKPTISGDFATAHAAARLEIETRTEHATSKRTTPSVF